jgi:hypothetical protein
VRALCLYGPFTIDIYLLPISAALFRHSEMGIMVVSSLYPMGGKDIPKLLGKEGAHIYNILNGSLS